MVLITTYTVSFVMGIAVLSQVCFSVAEAEKIEDYSKRRSSSLMSYDSESVSSPEPHLQTTERTANGSLTPEETSISIDRQHNTITMPPRTPKADGTPSPTGECLKLTYNSMKQIYEFPENYYHIWFKPLNEMSSISLVFDFSKYTESKKTDIPGHPELYEVAPWKWHRLELIVGKNANTNCSKWARLKIPTIDVSKCLPHHTISRVQVSSGKNMVIWSVCQPKPEWMDESTTDCDVKELNDHLPTITIVLAVCLAVAIAILILVGLYVWHLRTEVRNSQVQKAEPLYASWEEVSPAKVPMKMVSITITPPSSPSIISSGNCTFTTLA